MAESAWVSVGQRSETGSEREREKRRERERGRRRERRDWLSEWSGDSDSVRGKEKVVMNRKNVVTFM